MYKKKRNKRNKNKIKKENNKEKNALTRFFCGGGGGLFLSTILRTSTAWSSSWIRADDNFATDHFRDFAEMVQKPFC
jgi:hypothetical protein